MDFLRKLLTLNDLCDYVVKAIVSNIRNVALITMFINVYQLNNDSIRFHCCN